MRRALLAILLALFYAVPAQAACVSQATILAEITTLFADNTSGAITPTTLRQVTNDLANMCVLGTALPIATAAAFNVGTAAGTVPANGSNANFATVSATGATLAFSATAPVTGGATGVGLTVSSTTNLGIFVGRGVPTIVAGQGSLYLRVDGSSSSTRLYLNTDGAAGWVAGVL